MRVKKALEIILGTKKSLRRAHNRLKRGSMRVRTDQVRQKKAPCADHGSPRRAQESPRMLRDQI